MTRIRLVLHRIPPPLARQTVGIDLAVASLGLLLLLWSLT